MRESHIEAHIRKYAIQQGCLVYKFTSPGTRAVPDRIIISPTGKTAYLEVKAPGEEPTLLQLREIRRLREQGAKAGWVDSIDKGYDFVREHILGF